MARRESDSVSVIILGVPEHVEVRKLVLLPGMDGTGDLFVPFIEALPDSFETDAVSFPTDSSRSYPELAKIVLAVLPKSEPFVLVAESFSTPLALMCAASSPPNLKGLVICAGFAMGPVPGLKRFVLRLLAPLLFRLGLPAWLAKRQLLGSDALPALLAMVMRTISSVQPTVLSARLRSILDCDARTKLAVIKVPILYLLATKDRLVPARCAEVMREIKPEMKIVAINGPHLLFQREPRLSMEAIVKFVRQLT